MMTDKVQLFENQPIRTAWVEDEEEWYFSIVDVAGVLTESKDPTTYWRKLKQRLKEEGNETVTNCHALKMTASAGMTCAILEDGYRSGVNKGMIMDYIVEEKSNLGLDMQATEERIGGLIKHAGMSERTIAEHMHLSVQAINKWKHGKSLPDIENMYILSQILGKKVDDLLVPRVDVRKFMIECDSTCYEQQPQKKRIREYFSLLSHRSFQPQVE